jgi:hypothetical protein
MRRIVVQIDRLVLSGFRRVDAQAIADGLKSEMTARFAARQALGRLAASSQVRRLRPGAITIHDDDGSPRAAGTTAGASIVDALIR